MQIKATRNTLGLNPSEFVGIKTIFEIDTANKQTKDCLQETIKEDSKGRNYSQYDLFLVGTNGRYIGEFCVRFLFDRDLNELIKAFGEETNQWVGKRIFVWSVEEKKADKVYFRWKFEAIQ